MTKCLLKALKAVNLENYVDLFRSLGYDSAGALAHFHQENFKKLNFTSEEFSRFHALLDVLKQATREGKICPHYSKSNPIRAKSTESINHHRNTQIIKTNTYHCKKKSNENVKPKRSSSSLGLTGRNLSTTHKTHANGYIVQRPSSSLTYQQKVQNDQQFFGPKSLGNRPPIQHVKVKSYNYGIPTNRQGRNTSHHVHYQHETNPNHPSVFVSSSYNQNDIISYAKPAEIYVYARKRPLLSSETNLLDMIIVPDNKHIIISENKANLDCTPLLKKSEFQFDQVFSSDVTNKQIFECTVYPFLTSDHRQNLTYICFGQTGSGKSHTIFGSRHTDGLLIHCTQLLLQEINFQTKLYCSFYEIYNNQVYDLINTGKRLFVREDGEHHVNIVGLTEIALKTLDTLRSIIYDGLVRRHHGKSAFNSNSSRSHAIFQLILKNSSNQMDYFRLVFIDLAGSERATDAQNNQKQTRREGAQINSSLLALKECIRSMDLTNSHAPFRQSKLTHILRDSLVGNKTRTCLMANVSPADDCCQCSLNTLQYASRIRDISIKHRQRSIPFNHLQQYSVDNNHYQQQQQQQTVGQTDRNKSQKIFRPATASTPVHRLISAVDHRTYMSTNQIDADTRRRARKSSDNNWQMRDNEIPISGSGDNIRIKSALSSTREFLLNSNNNQQNTTSSFYLTRYEQPRKKNSNQEENVSSYFPPPQTDVKRSSPPPLPLSDRRLSDVSTEPSNSARIIPIQVSDDNQYSSTTATESLGTKITKLATGTNLRKKTTRIENLNLHKQYDTATTTDTEQGFYSDRQATHRDQTGFFSNRDDPLYENDFKPHNLSTITQRTSPITTPKNSSYQAKSDVVSSSSKRSFSSPTKNHHHRNRPIQSSSSSSSLTSLNSEKDRPRPSSKHHHHHHHRIVPYQNSDSDETKSPLKKSISTRNESCQTTTSSTITDIHIMKNQQEQTDDQFLLEQFSDQPSTQILQAPLDQIKQYYNQTKTTFISPLKDLGVRASDQLNTLRTLLERKLFDEDNRNDLSVLQASSSPPPTLTKDFLQSYKYKNNSHHLISDLDDDDNEHGNHQHMKINNDKYQSDVISSTMTTTTYTNQNESSLNDDIHHRTNHSPTSKIDTYESRRLSTSTNGMYSHKSSISNSDVIESTGDSERLLEPTSGLHHRYTTLSSSSSKDSSRSTSRSHTPVALPSRLNAFNITNDTDDQLIDSSKSSSLLNGTSFDVLMNSLKTMREKDLDYLLLHNNDDSSLIHLTD